jgi:transcriptional accessory protein Tex/SPT6
LKEIPSYAYLAMFRAEKEKQISVDIWMSWGRIVEKAKKYFMPRDEGEDWR